MGKALYRKYRSKKLDEVIGQDHITKTLSNALKTGKISHAYLLTGPRGVGKTSVARILAHEVNGFKYDEQHNLDIIEIDAASNRRIDEIRDLRDKVHIAPSIGKYKVYIIDEVHMLTKEAFNALLKTLEEPPEHVIFILATTEVHKLPETIISRTQRYTFRPIDKLSTIKHLKSIAKSENVDIDDEALALIAEHGDGSFRDSISLLDQAGSGGQKITANDINQLLGIPPAELITKLLDSIASKTAPNMLKTLEDVYEQGYSAAQVAKKLGQILRASIIDGSPQLGANTVGLMGQLIRVQASSNPERQLEVTLLGEIIDAQPASTDNPASVPNVIPKPQPIKAKASASTIKEVPKIPITKSSDFTVDTWQAVLAQIKTTHNTLYSVLRMADPKIEGNTLLLGFKFAFHNKQVSDSKNRQLIDNVVRQHCNQQITIKTVVDGPNADSEQVRTTDNEHLKTISNIFGGAEVLDS